MKLKCVLWGQLHDYGSFRINNEWTHTDSKLLISGNFRIESRTSSSLVMCFIAITQITYIFHKQNCNRPWKYASSWFYHRFRKHVPCDIVILLAQHRSTYNLTNCRIVDNSILPQFILRLDLRNITARILNVFLMKENTNCFARA